MSHPVELNRSPRRKTPDRHNFFTLLSVVLSERTARVKGKTMTQIFIHRRRLHRHTSIQTHVLLQRLGVPYEVERTVCSGCGQVLDERPLRRAVA